MRISKVPVKSTKGANPLLDLMRQTFVPRPHISIIVLALFVARPE